ncbi:MAG: hypothetical protein C5B58_09475 [Acidobacteria bacterium]|nr:MAG: hypothetical protein C5B58_09475 [Acidobacteriota bacterium]
MKDKITLEKPDIHKMAFKVDDLLINILPTKVTIGDTTLKIEELVWCLDHFFCFPGCTRWGCIPPPPHHHADEISTVFAKLKKDLKEQLKRRTTEQIREEMGPQSVKEVEELQKKLQAALVELESRRVELEGRKDR